MLQDNDRIPIGPILLLYAVMEQVFPSPALRDDRCSVAITAVVVVGNG